MGRAGRRGWSKVPSLLRARHWLIAVVLLAGWTATPPAAYVGASSDDRPITKWLPGERKPEPTSSALPSLGLTLTTPSVSILPSLATTGPAIVPPAPSVAPTVSVRSRLEPDQRRFHLGGEIALFVELSWVGDAGDVAPEAPEEPTLMNLTKKGMVQSSRILPQGSPQTVVVTYHYILEPTAEGAASIEPIQIPYRLRGGSDLLRFTSDRFALTILPRRWPWGKILFGAFATVVVLGIATAAAMATAARIRRAREAAKVPPPPSPLEQMKAELGGIRRLFTEGAAKDAYDSVERFIRKALGLRLGGDLRYATISELGERLANETLDSAVRDRAASILDRCAQVKFAGYVPTVADQDQTIADCRLLLDDLEKKDEGKGLKDEL